MPDQLVAGLQRDGFQFHRWSWPTDPGPAVVRLVTSFATGEAEVDALLEAAASIDSRLR